MLIAMMGNTYGIVIESAEKEFLKAWAKVMIVCQLYKKPTQGDHVVGALGDRGAGKRIP